MIFKASIQNAVRICFLLGILSCNNQKSATDGLDNTSFDVWCGDNPCAWKVEVGHVEPAPTWHRKAVGIRFAGDPARISQVIRTEQLSCVLLSLLGDTSGDAVLHFQVDTCNDGLDDRDPDIALPDGNWKTVYREANLAQDCLESRIILEKTGAGDAVIAFAKLTQDSYCAENPPPTIRPEDGGIDGGVR